jgi:hypothetical protein
MRAVAKGLAAGLFASAEKLGRAFVGCPFDRRKLGALVAAIAKRLFAGEPAGTPEIAFPGFNLDANGGGSGDVTLGHENSSMAGATGIHDSLQTGEHKRDDINPALLLEAD